MLQATTEYPQVLSNSLTTINSLRFCFLPPISPPTHTHTISQAVHAATAHRKRWPSLMSATPAGTAEPRRRPWAGPLTSPRFSRGRTCSACSRGRRCGTASPSCGCRCCSSSISRTPSPSRPTRGRSSSSSASSTQNTGSPGHRTPRAGHQPASPIPLCRLPPAGAVRIDFGQSGAPSCQRTPHPSSPDASPGGNAHPAPASSPHATANVLPAEPLAVENFHTSEAFGRRGVTRQSDTSDTTRSSECHSPARPAPTHQRLPRAA